MKTIIKQKLETLGAKENPEGLLEFAGLRRANRTLIEYLKQVLTQEQQEVQEALDNDDFSHAVEKLDFNYELCAIIEILARAEQVSPFDFKYL